MGEPGLRSTPGWPHLLGHETETKRKIAGAASAILVIAFQLQLLTFLSPLFVQNKTVWPVFYYSFWILIIGAAIFSFPKDRPWPVVLLCGALIALTTCYPVDVIAKNFIVAMVFVLCAASLATAAGSLKVLQLSAAATALSSCICLADILFVHDLTHGADRAVGLAFNPNHAAIGLLLGATAGFRAIPIRLIPYFVVLVGFAIFATLSKSMLLAFALTFGTVALVHLLRRRPIPRLAGAAVLALALVTYLGFAWSQNYRFRLATSNAFHSFSMAKLEKARMLTTDAAATNWEPLHSSGQIGKSGSDSGILTEEIRWYVGDDSVSARVLFTKQAWLAYRDGPAFGIGLDRAHAYAPHNSFLLFALAFGPLCNLVLEHVRRNAFGFKGHQLFFQ